MQSGAAGGAMGRITDCVRSRLEPIGGLEEATPAIFSWRKIPDAAGVLLAGRRLAVAGARGSFKKVA
jgi:hypothetical protein